MTAVSIGSMRWTIQIMRRSMVTPQPYDSEVDHGYAVVLTSRAHCKTRGGTSEFNRVVINNTAVTHTFTIRFTSIPIDIRDRVVDTQRNMYTILAVEPVDEARVWLRLHCARAGSIDRPSVT